MNEISMKTVNGAQRWSMQFNVVKNGQEYGLNAAISNVGDFWLK